MALTPGDVTQFLRDYADVNILLDNLQFTEDDVNKAMQFTVSRYNLLSPTTTYTADNFPNEWLFLIGVCSHLMHSEAFLQLRNQVDYQDGDIQNPGIDNKFALYKQLSDSLASDGPTMPRNSSSRSIWKAAMIACRLAILIYGRA